MRLRRENKAPPRMPQFRPNLIAIAPPFYAPHPPHLQRNGKTFGARTIASRPSAAPGAALCWSWGQQQVFERNGVLAAAAFNGAEGLRPEGGHPPTTPATGPSDGFFPLFGLGGFGSRSLGRSPSLTPPSSRANNNNVFLDDECHTIDQYTTTTSAPTPTTTALSNDNGYHTMTATTASTMNGGACPTTPTKKARRPSLNALTEAEGGGEKNNHKEGKEQAAGGGGAATAGAVLLTSAGARSPEKRAPALGRKDSSSNTTTTTTTTNTNNDATGPAAPVAPSGERRLITQLLKQFKQTAEVRQYLKYYGRCVRACVRALQHTLVWLLQAVLLTRRPSVVGLWIAFVIESFTFAHSVSVHVFSAFSDFAAWRATASPS